MQIIPALDLRDARVVRLEQGDYARETVYGADPAAVAAGFVEAGAERLHVVDLDGARQGRVVNAASVKAILDAVAGVPVQLGGGIRSLEELDAVLSLGVDRVILGTLALESPDLLREAAQRFPNRIVLGLDARDGRVAIRGWLELADATTRQVLEKFSDLPLAAVLHTDIGRDGMLSGPNLEATSELARSTQFPVIASGGVSSLADLLRLAQTRVIAGAVVGRALYSGAVDLTSALRQVAEC